jgi:hypothetical protein
MVYRVKFLLLDILARFFGLGKGARSGKRGLDFAKISCGRAERKIFCSPKYLSDFFIK